MKAAKNNIAAADPENFTGLECYDLFQEIKYEANNSIWVKLLGYSSMTYWTKLERRPSQ